MSNQIFLAVLASSVLLCAGCRSTYYSAWEKMGVHKRDLLKKRVVAARDSQEAASEQFKDALTRLREVYAFDGGELEKAYTSLKSSYDRSKSRADAVHERIRSVETVASDLFEEWESEIQQISTASLRANSQQRLTETRTKYQDLLSALKRAEQSMEPVLTRFNDQVLYLKHNLNAAAIASLKGESLNIQSEIRKLLEEMNTAIDQADRFIATLE